MTSYCTSLYNIYKPNTAPTMLERNFYEIAGEFLGMVNAIQEEKFA